jgi:hypothetical protein
MIRTLTGIGFALALVGSAHAQDAQVAVKLDGKSPSAIRSELYRAAEKVCAEDASAFEPVDSACVEATYTQALQQLRATPRVERTAYIQASPTGLR